MTLVSHSPLAHHILLTLRNTRQPLGTVPGAISHRSPLSRTVQWTDLEKGPAYSVRAGTRAWGLGQPVSFTAVRTFADNHRNTAHMGFGIGNEYSECGNSHTESSNYEDDKL